MRRVFFLRSIQVGLCAFIVSFIILHVRGYQAGDFQWIIRAGQALWLHENPYTAISYAPVYPLGVPFFYPLPAALVGLPFAWLDSYIAGALFFGLSAALLAYGIQRAGKPWQMGIFFSAPLFVAAFVGQWSPLLLAGAFLPALQVFMPCKPTIAAASFIAQPSRKGLLYGVLITLISLLIAPGWPIDWLHNVLQQVNNHRPPVFGFPGIILLLGLAAWKKREAWILLWMAIVPQTPFFYDQMALWLIPKTRSQLRVMNIFSWLAFGVWFFKAGLHPMNGILPQRSRSSTG